MLSLYSKTITNIRSRRVELKTLELRRHEGKLSDSEIREVLNAMVFELKLQNPDESFIVHEW